MRSILRFGLGLAVLAASIWLVPTAGAATARMVNGTLVFTAAPGEANDVDVGEAVDLIRWWPNASTSSRGTARR